MSTGDPSVQPEDRLFDGLVDGEPYPPTNHVLRQLPVEIENVAERRDHAWLRADAHPRFALLPAADRRRRWEPWDLPPPGDAP